MCQARVSLSITKGKDCYEFHFKGSTFPVFQLFEQTLNFALISGIPVKDYSAIPETANCMMGNLQITLGYVTEEIIENLKAKLKELFSESLTIL